MSFLKYLAEHGWSLFEHSVVGAGLFFHGLFYWQDIKVRRVENLIRFTEQHQKIVSELLSNPKTERVFEENADPSTMTPHELYGINSVFRHLYSGWRADKAGLYELPENIDEDVRELLSLPIPKTAWEQLKASYNRDFARYVRTFTLK